MTNLDKILFLVKNASIYLWHKKAFIGNDNNKECLVKIVLIHYYIGKRKIPSLVYLNIQMK